MFLLLLLIRMWINEGEILGETTQLDVERLVEVADNVLILADAGSYTVIYEYVTQCEVMVDNIRHSVNTTSEIIWIRGTVNTEQV